MTYLGLKNKSVNGHNVSVLCWGQIRMISGVGEIAHKKMQKVFCKRKEAKVKARG